LSIQDKIGGTIMRNKRVISLVIVFTLLLSIFNVAFAESGTVYAWNDGSWKNSANDDWNEGDWIPIKLIPKVPVSTTTPEAIVLTVGMEYTKNGSEPIGFDGGKDWEIGTDSSTLSYTDLGVSINVDNPKKFVSTNGSEVLHYTITVPSEALIALANQNWALYGKVHASEAGEDNLFAGGTVGTGSSTWTGYNLQIEYVEANQTASFDIDPAPAVYSVTVDKTVSKDETNYSESVTIYEGEAVRYKVTVSNEGNVALNNVVINDSMLSSPITVGTIQVGGSTTEYYDKTFATATEGPVTNTAVVSADNADDVNDTAEVTVDIRPEYALGIEKTVSKDETNYSESVTIYEGEAVRYKVTVSNEGNVALNNVVINDSMLSSPITVGTIQVGGSTTEYYDKTFATATDGPVTNTAIASADNVDDVDDTAEVTVDIRPEYAIGIEKTVSKDETNYSESVTIYEGEAVRYKVTVSNEGNVALNNVVINDSMLSSPITVGTIQVGGATTEYYDKTFATATDGPVTNTAIASADNVDDVDDTAEVTVRTEPIIPTYGLTIDKIVDDSSVYTNVEVTYTVTLENIGNQDLYIDFTDIDGFDLNEYESFELLAESTTTRAFTTSYSSTGDKVNVAEATYYEYQEVSVTVSDSAIVDVNSRPSTSTDYRMSITKTADQDEVMVGDSITYTITVKNIDDGTLREIVVTDDLVGLDEEIAVLSEGDSVVFTVDYIALEEGLLENTAKAVDDRAGTKTATAEVLVKNDTPLGLPGLTIDKSIVGDKTEFFPEEIVEFKIIVTNTGNTKLENIIVEDPMVGLFGYKIDELEPNTSEEIFVNMTVTEDAEDFTNVATATTGDLIVSDDAEVNIGEKIVEEVQEETVPLDVPNTGAAPMMLLYGLGALGVGAGWSIFDRKKNR
jgi:uncharacterized repeat protein (TIGR01451 family)